MSREKTNIYSLFVDYVPGYMLNVSYASSHLFCKPIMTYIIIIPILCMRKLRLKKARALGQPCGK